MTRNSGISSLRSAASRKASSASVNRSRERLWAATSSYGNGMSGIEPHGLFGGLNPSFIIARAECDPARR